MARWYGKVGFIETEETKPGVWGPVVTERFYSGDFTRNHKRWDNSQGINDDIVMQNEIRLVLDPYAIQNFQSIRYVEYIETLWKVTAVDVQYPRLVLSIGGVYNGEQVSTAD